MTAFTLATIVEGDGDVLAVPPLLRRLRPEWHYPRPIRIRRTQLVNPSSMAPVIEHYARIAEAAIQERGGIGDVLVLIDAEGDCPADLGPRIKQHLNRTLPHRQGQVVLAKTMFETWLIAGCDLDQQRLPGDPESLANPVAMLRHALGRYKKTADQVRLAAQCDLHRAQAKCPSFARLLAVLQRLDA